MEELEAAGTDAAAGFFDCGMRLKAGRTLVDMAVMLVTLDTTAPVPAMLDRAGTIAARCGSARLIAEVERQRQRLTEQVDARTGLAALTARERDIATRASTGRTSAEIARELFLSVRTVDTHLSRIYRKLGVSSRAALTRMLLQGGPPH